MVLPFQRKLYSLQMSIHAYVNTGDGPVDGGAILELDGDRLVVQLHQEPDELHLGGGREGERRRAEPEELELLAFSEGSGRGKTLV